MQHGRRIVANDLGKRFVMDDAHVALILTRFDEINRQLAEGSEGRRRTYEKVEAINREVLVLAAKVGSLEGSVNSMSPTVAEFVTMKQQAQGAGKLGSFLWNSGRVLLAAAAGAAAYWATWAAWFKGPPH